MVPTLAEHFQVWRILTISNFLNAKPEVASSHNHHNQFFPQEKFDGRRRMLNG
jgi:hypothetical protein